MNPGNMTVSPSPEHPGWCTVQDSVINKTKIETSNPSSVFLTGLKAGLKPHVLPEAVWINKPLTDQVVV
jgi:hypothetical protein